MSNLIDLLLNYNLSYDIFPLWTNYLRPIDIFIITRTCKDVRYKSCLLDMNYKKIKSNFLMILVNKFKFVRSDVNCDYIKNIMLNFITEFNCMISGSTLLQLLLDENWENSDIDFYARYDYNKIEYIHMINCDTMNNKCISTCHIGKFKQTVKKLWINLNYDKNYLVVENKKSKSRRDMFSDAKYIVSNNSNNVYNEIDNDKMKLHVNYININKNHNYKDEKSVADVDVKYMDLIYPVFGDLVYRKILHYSDSDCDSDCDIPVVILNKSNDITLQKITKKMLWDKIINKFDINVCSNMYDFNKNKIIIKNIQAVANKFISSDNLIKYNRFTKYIERGFNFKSNDNIIKSIPPNLMDTLKSNIDDKFNNEFDNENDNENDNGNNNENNDDNILFPFTYKDTDLVIDLINLSLNLTEKINDDFRNY